MGKLKLFAVILLSKRNEMSLYDRSRAKEADFMASINISSKQMTSIARGFSYTIMCIELTISMFYLNSQKENLIILNINFKYNIKKEIKQQKKT